MTPQLQQAIKMLQLSNLELNALIEGEIEQNPLLERSERDPDDRAEPGTEPGPVIDGDMASISEPSVGEAVSDAVDDWRAAAGDEGDGTAEIAGDASWRGRNGSSYSDELPGIDQTASRPRTLREHLIEQIGADLPDQADRVIALHLLDQLDEAGYLQGGLEGAAQRLGCAPAA